jgi:beta-glucosidase
LPLNRDQLKTILVMGPNADVAHGRGGGSSQVKTPFEITPLDGLKKKLGDDVKVIHLKAAPPASAGLPPIGADFIATRHPGAGTPACKILVYDDTKREKQSSIFWSPSARLRFDDGEMHHQRLVANLVPLRDGKHLFRVEADGVVELRVNGKKMLSSSQATLGEELEAEVELKKGRSYKVQLNYDGNQGYTLGWNAPGNPYVDETVYLKAANEADAVIYFGGLNHSYDREADDRANMKLPGNQDYVIPKLLEANPNTVVWMVAGSAVEMPWVNQVDSVLWGWYGGMFTGQAYADVLLGDVVPSGKMPFTLPRKLADNPHVHLKDYDAENCFYREGVMMGYRWFDEKEIMPMFPFGHGLSYSTFEFSDLEVSSKQFDPGDKLTVTFTIKNAGSVAAAEVGQVYVEDMASSVARPRKELKGFKKVWLKSGESKSVDVELNHRSFAFWDESTNSWKVEPGKFQIHVGDSVSGIKLRGVITAK